MKWAVKTRTAYLTIFSNNPTLKSKKVEEDQGQKSLCAKKLNSRGKIILIDLKSNDNIKLVLIFKKVVFKEQISFV